jgi:hypothetical protein
MNGSVIAGLLLVSIAALVLGVGFVSGNMFVNLRMDTNRRSAPAAFWAVASIWMLIASFGFAVALTNWGR